MVRCWNVNPDFRPFFDSLRKRMEAYIRDKVCNSAFDNKILESDLSFLRSCTIVSSDSPSCIIFSQLNKPPSSI